MKIQKDPDDYKENEKLKVGEFKFGLRIIRLFLVPRSSSGAVYIIPDDGGLPRIEVGMGDSWEECLGLLLHEAFELAFIDLNTRFTASPRFSGSAADYLFVATHEQFGEVVERVGYFVAIAAPKLEAAARKWQADRKKVDKKRKKV